MFIVILNGVYGVKNRSEAELNEVNLIKKRSFAGAQDDKKH